MPPMSCPNIACPAGFVIMSDILSFNEKYDNYKLFMSVTKAKYETFKNFLENKNMTNVIVDKTAPVVKYEDEKAA